jgi:hypothetical protein
MFAAEKGFARVASLAAVTLGCLFRLRLRIRRRRVRLSRRGLFLPVHFLSAVRSLAPLASARAPA